MRNDETRHATIRPSVPLAVAIFLAYATIFIGVVALTAPDGFSYKHAFDDLKDSRPFVYGLLAGATFSICVATALGWWREILVDKLPVRGWLRLVPVIALVLILATTDYGHYSKIGHELLIWTIVAALLVGFAEELTFRGLVLVDLRKVPLTEPHVWLLSSLLFGLLHLPNALIGASLGGAVVQVFLAFAGGTIFYLVRRATGSILPAMVLHGLWDFTLFSAGNGFNGGGIRLGGELALFVAFLFTRRLAFDGDTTVPTIAPEPPEGELVVPSAH